MILCKHCGWPVTNVLVNCFNHDGSDTYQLFPISEPHGLDGIAEFFVPTTWTGYDLSDEERMETIKCHHCNKYPFDEKEGVNAKALIDVVCFEEGGGGILSLMMCQL